MLAVPTGLIWNADTLTCAYDSLLTILHSIKIEDPEKWANDFSDFSEYFQTLSQGWSGSNQKSLEEVRDDTQLSLSQKDPESFPMNNEKGTDLYALCEELFSASSCVILEKIVCQSCSVIIRISQRPSMYWQICGTGRSSVQTQFLKCLDCVIDERCTVCSVTTHCMDRQSSIQKFLH
jgi:hypothetical protein